MPGSNEHNLKFSWSLLFFIDWKYNDACISTTGVGGKMQSITDFSLIHIYASDTKKNNRKKLKNKKKQFSILKAKKSFLQLLKFKTNRRLLLNFR